MLQLTQKLRDGSIKIIDAPTPILSEGMILVKTAFSLISSGTEGKTAKTAQKSLLGKALEKPDQVKQVLEIAKNQGVNQAYNAVSKKLEAYSPSGYSIAGEVIECANDVKDFQVGDLVACGGVGFANHAEICAIPINLAVKLDKKADLKSASFNSIGAIALQSVRQADLKLGESCAVIGLGLIGQIVGLLLKASGIKVIGIDISDQKLKIANEKYADLALNPSDTSYKESILNWTGGNGVDGVIICASESGNTIINSAGEIARKKSTIVVLGDVGTGFNRDPDWYAKELTLKMSCSYGPGRYDPDYEMHGKDYPYHYVRWTEKRNMEAFQSLLQRGAIDVSFLITHEFDIKDSSQSYDVINDKDEHSMAVLVSYNINLNKINKTIYTGKSSKIHDINIGFIGAGNYALGNILPNIKDKNISMIGVLSNSGTTSLRVAERYGFKYCTSDIKKLMDDNFINTIFISTRHETHAKYAIDSILNGKNVYLDKPLCINRNELHHISKIHSKAKNIQLMVGYNRRFSVLTREAKSFLGAGKKNIIYRVNAGKIDSNNWIHDKKIGGGRLVGEVCHFVDFIRFITGSRIESVYARSINKSDGLNDNLAIILSFLDGSAATITYTSEGSSKLTKEYIEIHSNKKSVIISDFKKATFSSTKTKKKNLVSQDKGQNLMIAKFFQCLRSGEQTIPIDEIFEISNVCFDIEDSLRLNKEIKITDEF